MKILPFTVFCILLFSYASLAWQTITISPRDMTVKLNEAGKIEIYGPKSQKICEYELEELQAINRVISSALQTDQNIQIDLQTGFMSLAPAIELTAFEKIIIFLEPYEGFFPLGFHGMK